MSRWRKDCTLRNRLVQVGEVLCQVKGQAVITTTRADPHLRNTLPILKVKIAAQSPVVCSESWHQSCPANPREAHTLSNSTVEVILSRVTRSRAIPNRVVTTEASLDMDSQ